MTNHVIPEAAVEAAARATLALEAPNFPWADVTDEARARYLGNARAALEAAAPHLMAPIAAILDDYTEGEHECRALTRIASIVYGKEKS